MADLSVNQVSVKTVNSNQNSMLGQYAKLKAKYEQFKTKYKTSDFANAPTLLEQEIKLLKDLRAAALIENVAEEEIKQIDKRIDEIIQELKPQDEGNIGYPSQHIMVLNSKYNTDIVRSNIQEQVRNLKFDTKSFENLLEQAENPQQIRDFASKLLESEVSLEDVINVINMLSVPVVDDNGIKTGKFSISDQSVKSVITLQSAIRSYRQNEKNEVKSPVYNLDVDYEYSDRGFFIKRKNLVIYSEEVDRYGILNKPTLQEKRQQYENAVKVKERRVLFDFIKKYKNTNGIIPYQYAMSALKLEKSGIVNKELLNLLDSCIGDEGKINRNKLYKISALKEAGALSEDILKILDKCRINNDGKYNANDVETAIGLTKAVLGAKQVCELLPVIRDYAFTKDNVYTVYDFVISASKYFKNKDNLVQLVKMCMTDSNTIDEDAIDMIDTMFFNEKNDLTEEEFMDYALQILQLGRGNNDTVSDAATGICYGLSKINASLVETNNILKLCQGADGNINQMLGDIIWTIGINDKYKSECSVDDIIKLIMASKSAQSFDDVKIEKIMSAIKMNLSIKDILTQLDS